MKPVPCLSRSLLAVSLLVVVPALAQEPRAFSPITWQLNVGGSVTTGTTANYIHDGWIFGGGMRWTPAPDSPLAMLVELNYSGYQATHGAINLAQAAYPSVRTNDGSGNIFGINFNGLLNLGRYFYLTGGIGWDRRKLDLTQTVLVAGTYCDPFWYYCYHGVVPGEQTVADKSTTKFAWNVGGGFEWPIGQTTFMYIDARYRRIESTYKPTEYIPVQIGLRF